MLYLLKGEGPGGGNGFRMLSCRVFAPALVQGFAPLLVEFEVARQATSGLIDVGSGLVEGQWEPVKGLDNGSRLSANRVRNACRCSS